MKLADGEPGAADQRSESDPCRARAAWRVYRALLARRVAWVALLAVAGVAGVGYRHPFERWPDAKDRVVAASILLAGGERGPRASNGFDRIRIPAETTEVQLSLTVSKLQLGERLEAELEAVDSGEVTTLPPPIVEASSAGSTVSVVMPAPPDGDYVLRLRGVTGGSEVLSTSAFRITRLRSVLTRAIR